MTARVRRYAIVAGAGLGVLVLLSVVALWVRPGTSPSPEAVPARVYAPLPGQDTARSDPRGPGALLVRGTGAFSGNFDYEDYGLVVGRDGSYRMVRSSNAVLLSPDGRYVAGDGTLEGADVVAQGTAVLDLGTGDVRGYDEAGDPVAWSPDGTALLTWGDNQLRILTLATGAVRDLEWWSLTSPQDGYAAFAPNGSTLVVQKGQKLVTIDLATGASSPLPDLRPNQRLAGAGAFGADGRIALWEMTGCPNQCAAADLAARAHRLTYVDGKGGPQFDSVQGPGARLLGWQDDGDAVVLVFRAGPHVAAGGPAWPEDDVVYTEGPSVVVALHPGGGSTPLVELPGGAIHIQVAADLLAQDRFGGPAPSLLGRYGDWLAPKLQLLSVVVGVLLAIAAALFLVHRRTRGPGQLVGRTEASTSSTT